jgi:hypothetical protein
LKLIEDMRSGRLDPAKLGAKQHELDKIDDVFDTKTADEEERIVIDEQAIFDASEQE